MNEDNLDLLDLDDGASLDALPDAAPFVAPRPKKPWLLMGVGIIIIILATYVIVRTIASDSSSSVDVDLDAPVVVDVVPTPVATETLPMPPKPMPAEKPTPMPVAQPAPAAAPVAEPSGTPVRVIEDRKDVTFNPDKPTAPKPAAVAPAQKPTTAKPAPKKPAPQPQVAPKGSWYVQFGSYSTRALAQRAEKQIRASHAGLFDGRQFVILAAVLKDGSTTYRLRIAFTNSNDANGFCRNAKSDGLDCYVAK